MALKITRVNMGVVFTPRDEEVYSNTSGVLYPRVIELHHAGEQNGLLLATFDHSTLKEPPVVPVMCSRDHGERKFRPARLYFDRALLLYQPRPREDVGIPFVRCKGRTARRAKF